MRFQIILVFALLSVALTTAGDMPKPPSNANPQFDKLKGLVGTWKGKTDDGKDVGVQYTLVSGGSTVMESLSMGGDEKAMITMYHMDGTKLMMTHYCSMGNQPTMRAAKSGKDSSSIDFSAVAISNKRTAKENYMKNLKVEFRDADHFAEHWTMLMDGSMEHAATFEFERAK